MYNYLASTWLHNIIVHAVTHARYDVKGKSCDIPEASSFVLARAVT
jgi:hypothetical protein